MEKGIKTLRRENNKIVEKGKRKKLRREIKLTRERGRENIVRRVKKKRIWFAFLDYFNRFFPNRCVFDSFCFKRYLVSDFIASNYESRVLIDPC